jgi:transcriptional regulator with XRE-family HTH domain
MDYKAIGIRIRHKRKELNLTQADLAKRIGLTESSISKYEAGKIETMPTSTVNRICQVLSLAPAELLGLTPKKAFEYDLKEIINSADDLPDDVKADLLNLLKQQIKLCRRLYTND